MSNSEARNRYFLVFVPTMIVFLAACLAIAAMDEMLADIHPLAVYGAAVVPIAALLVLMWAQYRYAMELDEFLRTIQFKAILVGLAVILVVATAWGFVEAYADAPRLPIFWLNPIFWLGYGAGALFFSLRDAGSLA